MKHPISPMLCGWGPVPAIGDDFAARPGFTYELKWDGYRMIAVKRGADVQLYLRSGVFVTEQGWTDVIREAIQALPVDCVIDGEAIVLKDGWPSFNDFQNRMSLSRERRAADLKFMAFDVLSFGDSDIMDRPYSERRTLLEKLVAAGGDALTCGPSSTDATKLWKFVLENQLEGLISKPLNAKYKPGERGTWAKHKRFIVEEFAIVGYAAGGGRREGTFGALLVAEPNGDGLRICGSVGTGFTDAVLDDLTKRFEAIELDTPSILLTKDGWKSVANMKNVTWVRPELRCRVAYQERTTSNSLRGPASYQGLVA
jgi:bifunctional non-homologous end joining protein LigD